MVPKGRPRTYCDDSCKQQAYIKRLRQRAHGLEWRIVPDLSAALAIYRCGCLVGWLEQALEAFEGEPWALGGGAWQRWRAMKAAFEADLPSIVSADALSTRLRRFLKDATAIIGEAFEGRLPPEVEADTRRQRVEAQLARQIEELLGPDSLV
jgi:hypothetical protein